MAYQPTTRPNRWLTRAERKRKQELLNAVIIMALVLIFTSMFGLAALLDAGYYQ